jgi:cytochrome P450
MGTYLIVNHITHGSVQDTAEPAGSASKDFMAFGGGLRLCSGADFAKLQLAIFLHCLVTKYRCSSLLLLVHQVFKWLPIFASIY